MAILNFPPTAGEPIDGSFTYSSDGVTYSWDGYKWTADTGSGGGGDANHNDGPTPPTTGELADQWYNTDDGRLYTYTADSSGALVWIDASPDSIAGGSGGGGGTTDIYGTAKLRFTFDGPSVSISQGSGATASRISAGRYLITFDTPRTSDYYVALGSGNRNTAVLEKTLTSFILSTGSVDGVATDTTATIDVEIFDDVPVTVSGGSGGDGTTVNYSGASAWGNVATDGTINGSFNVVQVSQTEQADGTTVAKEAGRYYVKFATPMPTNTYAVTGACATAGEHTVVFSGYTSEGFIAYTFNTTSGLKNDRGFNFAVQSTNAIAPQSGVGADAWGSFLSSGSILGSFNTDSVTKSNTGVYVVTFTTPMPNASYCALATPQTDKTMARVASKSTTGFSIYIYNQLGNAIDANCNYTIHASSTVTPTYTWTRDGTTLKTANDGDGVEVDGNITGGSFNQTSDITGGFEFTNNGILKVQRPASEAANSVNSAFRVFGGSQETASISAAGSATFKKNINYGLTGYLADSDIGKILTGTSDGTFGTVLGVEPGSSYSVARDFVVCLNKASKPGREVMRIDGETGNTSYAAKISASDVTFNLETDNVANFSAEGEYTGPTLDVKALLLTLQTAATRIATLEAKVATLESDHTTLMNNNNNGGGY